MNEIKDFKSNKNKRHIKSSYVIKTVFSFLTEKRILDMIIYNKELQKKFSVDIENYKNLSKKYKKGEKNGKGSEYIINKDKNILIFEGEYLNGNEKEYYNFDKLKFEGEYLNYKKWNGKGYTVVALHNSLDLKMKIKNIMKFIK